MLRVSDVLVFVLTLSPISNTISRRVYCVHKKMPTNFN